MPFEFETLAIPDVILIKPKNNVFEDDRGFFMESYKYSDFSKIGIKDKFEQDNYSISKKGVLRGLHFQIEPQSQRKLVRCLIGEIYDVVVDIRKDSPTYLKWVGTNISEKNKYMLFIPEGFAHGFLALGEINHVFYKTTKEYSPKHDKGIRFDDPEININWKINLNDVILSEKDKTLPFINDIIL